MPKTKKRPRAKRLASTHSRLKDHRKRGSKLHPPILDMAGEVLQLKEWAKDFFPDFLWVCSHLSSGDIKETLKVGRLLDHALKAIGDDRSDFPENWVLTGSLRDFEAIPERVRTLLLEALEKDGIYEIFITEEFAHVLGMYPSAPGNWLLRPWKARGLSINPAVARSHLDSIIGQSRSGFDPVPTRAKATFFRQMIQAGRVAFPREIIEKYSDVISRYPLNVTESEAGFFESFVRSSFLIMVGDPGKWSAEFWRANWRLFACDWPNLEGESHEPEGNDENLIVDYLEEVKRRADNLWNEFFKLGETTDPDLYDPDRYEVLTGLIGRAIRHILTFADHPRLWTMEHGAPILRLVIETQIIFRYLISQEQSDSLYRRFKSYGTGRLKLRKLHFEEYTKTIAVPPHEMIEYLDYLEAIVNRDIQEEFQSIDLAGNFAGIDIRKMAIVVGMETEYRLLFAPASSNIHGEWSVIDDNVFVPCFNLTHRAHRILANPREMGFGPIFIESILDRVADLFAEYSDAMATGA